MNLHHNIYSLDNDSSSSISFLDDENYESYLERIILNTFKNPEKKNQIKSRLVMNFFTINDLKFLLHF